MVAGLDASDARTDFLDDSRSLVSEDQRQFERGGSVEDVDVRMAESRVRETHEDFAEARAGEFEFLDLDGLARCIQYGSCRFHDLLRWSEGVIVKRLVLQVNSQPIRTELDSLAM